jgi:hypothetical protein
MTHEETPLLGYLQAGKSKDLKATKILAGLVGKLFCHVKIQLA